MPLQPFVTWFLPVTNVSRCSDIGSELGYFPSMTAETYPYVEDPARRFQGCHEGESKGPLVEFYCSFIYV